MTNLISVADHTVNRPPLCRSDQQPNLLEYIDTTLNESFSLNLTLTRTITSGYDQFSNTILDQYLLYLLCQKIHPNRSDPLTYDLYQLLHQLIVLNGKISKAFLEYSPPITNRAMYQSIYNSYANFIWNELNVNVLLELGCFLLKYRLCDIFTVNTVSNRSLNSLRRQKIIGYFLEIIVIYYLSSHYHDFFIHSRSIDMIFPSPALYSSLPNLYQYNKDEERETFRRFLCAIHDNGEISFDLRQIRLILQSDGYQFVNKKLENKKFDFIHFFERNILYQQQNVCRSLKSLCRLVIKMRIKQYPTDIKQLSLYPFINDRLLNFLIYNNNKFAFQSYV
ncbi:hypothetical protein I4U23_025780 [Adineta vaga]|nr:hypothetical protein I4U23_025780 [Adineta vaga]